MCACVRSESMNDVTGNANHNFGGPLDARSVSENVGLLLKKS